jgi:hypothetical protein
MYCIICFPYSNTSSPPPPAKFFALVNWLPLWSLYVIHFFWNRTLINESPLISSPKSHSPIPSPSLASIDPLLLHQIVQPLTNMMATNTTCWETTSITLGCLLRSVVKQGVPVLLSSPWSHRLGSHQTTMATHLACCSASRIVWWIPCIANAGPCCHTQSRNTDLRLPNRGHGHPGAQH